MNDERVARLEERVASLERALTIQSQTIVAMSAGIRRISEAFATARDAKRQQLGDAIRSQEQS